MSAALLALAVAIATPAAPGPSVADSAGARIVSHGVEPSPAVLGARAMERLVLAVPRGARVTVADVASGDDDVERMGVWRAERSGGGTTELWTWSAPVAAWAPGTRTAPALDIAIRDARGTVTRIRATGARFSVSSPLPGGARVLRAAPARGAWPTGRWGWPPLLTLLQVMVTAGVALAWWHRGGRRAEGPGSGAAHPPPLRPLRELLAGVDDAPGPALLALARAVRRHPRVAHSGIGEAHTRAEIAELLDGDAVMPAVDALLALADVVAYGGHVPSGDSVRTAAAPVVEVLDRG